MKKEKKENEEEKKPQGEPAAAGEQTTVAVAAAATESSAEMEQRLAEAEQRGYLRGRNESIEALMQPPAGFGETMTGVADTTGNAGEPLILNNIRASIWEKGI